jgi:lysophospholipase L1-like esterase
LIAYITVSKTYLRDSRYEYLSKIKSSKGEIRMKTVIKKAILIALILGVYLGVSVSNEKTDNRQVTNLDVKSIVLLGASYVKGLRLAEINGYKLINKGVAGDTSTEMLDRFSNDVIALNPEKVILWGFINDIHNSDKNQVEDAVEKIKKSYIEMILLSQKNNIEPFLATEITMSRRPGIMEILRSWRAKLGIKPTYQDLVNWHVMAVNQWLKVYAKENGLRILDFQSLLAEGGVMRNKAYAKDDGGHPSKKGYDLITEYLSQKL